MRIFLIFICLLFSTLSWGQAVTITQVSAGDNVLTPSTGTQMVTDLSTSDEESGALAAYYPIDSASTAAIEIKNTIFSTNTGHPLPQVVYNAGSVAAGYAATPFIAFKIKNTFTTIKRVFVAFKKNGGSTTDYVVMSPLNAELGYGVGSYVNVPAGETVVRVALKDVCSVSTSSCYTSFNSFVGGSLSTIAGVSQLFYVYYVDPVTNPTYSPNPNVPVDTTSDSYPGFYTKINFSNQIPTPKPALTTLNLARGDTQLTINYSTNYFSGDGGSWKTLMLKVITTITDGDNIFDAIGGALVGPCTADGVPGDLNANQICYQLYPYQQNGSLTVSNLTNDTTYLLTVAHVSKFKFVTAVPTNGSGRPQEIQAFIKEQSCFFLSAGFGDRHFVLDYLRGFRDSVLLKNKLGKAMVNFYYQIAPQYTPYIYGNPLIAFLMRFVGYSFYYFLNTWLVVFSAMTALFAFVRFKKFL